MSVLERMCAEPGCLQCWAEEMLAASPEELEDALEQEIRAMPMMVMVGQPTDPEMTTMRRSGRRETRLFARLALLEPHECRRAKR